MEHCHGPLSSLLEIGISCAEEASSAKEEVQMEAEAAAVLDGVQKEPITPHSMHLLQSNTQLANQRGLIGRGASEMGRATMLLLARKCSAM
jgi:hypothetical protein